MSDATDAIQAAKDLGQTLGTTIYFTVDYDATASDVQGSITKYLQAVKAVFENKGYPYKLGLYGSGAVLTYFQNTFTDTWLAGASGWRGSKDYTDYAIRQYENDTYIGSGAGRIQIDKGESNGSAGGWRSYHAGITTR